MADLFSVTGKVVLVTGGSRGIGLMIARGFAAAGARVVISSRKADACARAADELSSVGTCHAVPADLSRPEGCEQVAEVVRAREGRLDVLVNNAGATWGAPLPEHDEAAWDRVLGVNLKGVFAMTTASLPLLEASGTEEEPARVVNIGSVDGLVVPPRETYSYSASKAAVHHLTRHLARRLAPTITVNAIAPGPFESKMMEATLREHGDEIVAAAPLGRIGRPDDIAGAALFLASRAGAYLTGAVIPVDGGISTVG